MKIAPGLLLVAVLVVAVPIAAQNSQEKSPEPATLFFQNREIITLHAMRGLFTPRDRVQNANQRLQDLLRDKGAGETSVAIADGIPTVTMHSKAIFYVLPGDVQPDIPGQEMTSETVATAAAGKLGEAVRAWSDQRRVSVVARGAMHTLIAAAIAGLAIWLLGRARVVALRWLCNRARERVAARPLVTGTNLLQPIIRSLQLLVGIGRVAAVATIVYLWLTYAFSQFPLTQPWGTGLAGFIGNAIATVGMGILNGIPALLLAILILFVTKLFARLVKTVFETIEQRRLNVRGIHADTAEAMGRIAVVLVWVFGIAMAFPFIPGSDSDAVKGVSVLFGLMITLGSSSIISQAMSGLVVVFSRAIKEGEYVRVGDFEGTVAEVGALSAKICTPRNEEITIPNSVLVSSPTHNYSRLAGANGVVVFAKVGIGYNAPWREVHAALVEAAQHTTGLRKTPAPYVRQATLSAFCVEYTINAYLDRPETRLAVLSELHANIQDAFSEREIQIMVPAFESQPKEPVVPKKDWFGREARPTGT